MSSKRSSVNSYNFPRIFWAHAFQCNCDHLQILVYPQLGAGTAIFNTNEHSPNTGTPVCSESCKFNPKHIFIITNTMHTIEVDKITLFKTTLNNVFSPTCFDPHWIIIREVYTLLAKLLCRLINWKGDLVACQCCSGYVSLTRFVSTFCYLATTTYYLLHVSILIGSSSGRSIPY